ncbi:unnamed protein product [Caenorhabditis brenneri]
MASDKKLVIDGYILFLIVLVCFSPALLFIAWRAYVVYKSKRKGPITLTPVIPFPQDNLQVFKGTNRFKNVVSEAKIQVCNENNFELDIQREDHWAIKEINEFMASVFKLDDRLPHEYEEVRTDTGEKCYRKKPKISVPVNARTISIKMDGYEHGEKCHDFEPIGGAVIGSHFTYQMYGDNRIQVTRYVLNGFSDIAGFCIYIERPGISPFEYRWTFLHWMARSVRITENSQMTKGKRENQPTIEVVREENTNLISDESDDREWTGKYCSKRRRKVMTSMDPGEVVLHQEWSDRNNRMRIERCEECTKEGLRGEEQPPAYSSIFIG